MSADGTSAPVTERVFGAAAVALLASAATLLLAWWLLQAHAPPVTLRTPLEHPPEAGSADPQEARSRTDLRGSFTAFAALGGALPPSEAWPNFRGPELDNVSRSPVRLADRWSATGPAQLWAVDLGEGHAGAAVQDGRVYLLDYLEEQESDALRCFALDDGRELWRRWYWTGAKRNHGVSRTVPAVSGGHVVTIGPRCHVLCADAVSGEFHWGLDLVQAYGTEEPLWYTAQCPLIDDGRVILAPGGRALLVALDLASGEVLWETPNPRGWQMSHASVVPMTVAGQRMFVYAALGGLAGVAADGPDAGTLLWQTAEWNPSVAAPTPVPLDDGRLFATAGYGYGSALFQIVESSGGFRAELVQRLDRRQFACEQQTPVAYRGRLFGILPKDAGALREQFACLQPEGGVLWSSGKQRRFGLGPFLAADGKFLVLADRGELALVDAAADHYRELARAQVLDGRDAWAPMALADGRLLLRDSKRLVCLDLRPEADHGAAL